MHTKNTSKGDLQPEDFPAPGQYLQDNRIPSRVSPDSLTTYLTMQENSPDDIVKLKSMLQMDKIILEIGCGSGGIAREIAQKNPDIGVIATDQYAWAVPARHASNYEKTALAWKEKRLENQSDAQGNLALLRADLNILYHFPENCVDTILLVNSEPNVGLAFMKSLRDPVMYRKIKSGEKQVVLLPFSKEMGVACCGGYEFDHSEDWSPGLGFMMASGFDFHRGEPVQWHVNLVKSSPYSANSTQKDVYIFRSGPQPDGSVKKPSGFISKLNGFVQSAKHAFTFQI